MNKYSNSLKIVKCRGIILHDGKMLVAKHIGDHDFYALPGGHLEEEENPKECVEREILEEFGVKPEVGKLLYTSQYKYLENDNFLELFFEVKNAVDYLDIGNLRGSHSHELVDIIWISKTDNIKILPQKIMEDFKNGILGQGGLQFLK